MNPAQKLKKILFNIEGYGKFISGITPQGCGIAMPDSPDSYIEPAGQVDFPG